MFVVQFLILSVLVSITWQDFKYRAVYWFFFPLLMILFIVKNVHFGLISYEDNFINLGIIALQISILHIYYYVKHGDWLLHQAYLGWGDVLFFVALTMVFPPLTFLAFQLASLILTLLWFILFKKFMTNQEGIPLAGCQSFLLAMLFLGEFIAGPAILNIDGFIIDSLNGIYAQ